MTPYRFIRYPFSTVALFLSDVDTGKKVQTNLSWVEFPLLSDAYNIRVFKHGNTIQKKGLPNIPSLSISTDHSNACMILNDKSTSKFSFVKLFTAEFKDGIRNTGQQHFCQSISRDSKTRTGVLEIDARLAWKCLQTDLGTSGITDNFISLIVVMYTILTLNCTVGSR
jgi:hypothetical protein